MVRSAVLFWNVDTQIDFVEPGGNLYIKGAEKLKPKWAEITKVARRLKIKVVNTADYHYVHSAEINEHPDMVSSFPVHCLAGTRGAEFIKETEPDNPLIFNWDTTYDIMPLKVDVPRYRNFVIRKDAFDVFAGNPVTIPLLTELNPDIVVVYGVSTNVCVDFAVQGLAKRVKQVYVLSDGIKELPRIPLPYEQWEKLGVKMISSVDLYNSFK
ncbi:MAG: isochorismatase family protein [Prolixibacteraceae bacterium]|jgi:nicotinamidase/pyrazinamidase|nr:cysteine hydrolase [Prolixibacteraceae bacterium]MDI9563304.1 isochorismatase family protein [Bacteroidota bacterium]NLS98638.1 cysteine hydrolase [Bacteroidales bacterium]OQB80365.1 MAG: Isochorismatase family protein [Bacteroidetes bacterium ADurb.Bin123]HNU77564.1 isochorismatase family protein [Prolixibacteraceae bacterium]